MRTFVLYRINDISDVSGTGIVADGVQFPNGKCALCWRTDPSSIGIYNRIEDIKTVHGHNGSTIIKWLEY